MIQQTHSRKAMGLRILPSSMTVLALCAGLTSIKYSLDHKSHLALALIAIAAILDGLDGRVARILEAQSRIGAELDSLADAIDFGVAPAIVIYVSMLSSLSAGWIVVLLYTVCIVLRLARFNSLLEDTTTPAYTREFFVGMPAPAGAICLLGLLAAQLQFGPGWWTSQWWSCIWISGISFLLVSRIPMRKLHTLSVPPHLMAALLVGLALVAAAAFLFPYILILVLIGLYLATIPFSIRNHHWIATHPESWNDAPKVRRATRRAYRRAQQPTRRSISQIRRLRTKNKSMSRLGLHKPGEPHP